MAIFQKKHEPTEAEKEEIRVQDFFDRITPSTIKFYPDRYLCGAAYHCVWVIREYLLLFHQTKSVLAVMHSNPN
ncbi:MAG: hypothetical protein ACI4JQ_02385 [Ruminococcus sp.]